MRNASKKSLKPQRNFRVVISYFFRSCALARLGIPTFSSPSVKILAVLHDRYFTFIHYRSVLKITFLGKKDFVYQMIKTKKLPLVKASSFESKEAVRLEETCVVQLSCGPCINKRCKISSLIFLNSRLLLTQRQCNKTLVFVYFL